MLILVFVLFFYLFFGSCSFAFKRHLFSFETMCLFLLHGKFVRLVLSFKIYTKKDQLYLRLVH